MLLSVDRSTDPLAALNPYVLNLIRTKETTVPQHETFDVVILGSGQGGKHLAWHLGDQGKALPSWSANGSAARARPWHACPPRTKSGARGWRISSGTRPASAPPWMACRTDMARVRRRKQDMIDREIELHLGLYQQAGAELIMGTGRFIRPKTIEVALNDGGTRVLAGNEIVINVGSHAAIPDIPGLRDAHALTHIEALELADVPPHLIVLGGGYTGIELAQAYGRFGSRVTIIEPGPQIMGREDADVAEAMGTILGGEGIDILLSAKPLRVSGRNGQTVSVTVADSGGRTDDRRQSSAGGGWPGREYGGHWPRRSWSCTQCARLHSGRRAAEDNRPRCLCDRRMRWQPAVHARLGR